jgi:hypothetical protein
MRQSAVVSVAVLVVRLSGFLPITILRQAYQKEYVPRTISIGDAAAVLLHYPEFPGACCSLNKRVPKHVMKASLL